MQPHRILIWIAWAAFLLSLALPAGIIDMGAWDKPDAKYVPGFACAFVGWPHWASNAALLLAPLIFWTLDRWVRSPWPRFILALFFLLSGVGCFLWLDTFRTVGVGFAVWVAAYLLAFSGACIAMFDRARVHRVAAKLG